MKKDQTQSWIYKCLMAEEPGSAHKLLSDEDVADLTKEFLLDLRSIFEHFVQAFNDLKKENIETFEKHIQEKSQKKLKGSILIYDLKDGKGFMIFRKGYRLIFSYVEAGCVKVQFVRQKPFGETESFVESFLRAVTHGTMSINWTHDNHNGFININILARYYMRRFLQET